MTKLLESNKFRIIIILLAAALACGISLYRSRTTKLLDKALFSEFKSSIDELYDDEGVGFEDQRALMDFIEKWAESNELEYLEDNSGNIIFDRAAAGRKNNVTPTLIAVSMNYQTAGDNSGILASSASIAASDVESGRRTVIFVNDEQNLGSGYKGIGNS